MSSDVVRGAVDPAELQRRLVAFVRAFGLHKGDETPCGVPIPVSEAHALSALAEAGPDGVSQSELGGRLALTKSTVSRLVDQLVDRGWAERRAGRPDGRVRTIVLTPAGDEVAGQVASARADRLARLLDRIPPAERPGVLAALQTLVEAADEA
jgi:DNA-binding MarR family transcriptional regulator